MTNKDVENVFNLMENIVTEFSNHLRKCTCDHQGKLWSLIDRYSEIIEPLYTEFYQDKKKEADAENGQRTVALLAYVDKLLEKKKANKKTATETKESIRAREERAEERERKMRIMEGDFGFIPILEGSCYDEKSEG